MWFWDLSRRSKNLRFEIRSNNYYNYSKLNRIFFEFILCSSNVLLFQYNVQKFLNYKITQEAFPTL